MWLCTRYGFFSLVLARQDGGRSMLADPATLQVRARKEEHLENLRQRFPMMLRGCPIKESAGTDYRWRLIVPKSVMVELVAGLCADIDYTNFKNAAKAAGGDDAYLSFLSRTWGAGLSMTPSRLQPSWMYEAPSRAAYEQVDLFELPDDVAALLVVDRRDASQLLFVEPPMLRSRKVVSRAVAEGLVAPIPRKAQQYHRGWLGELRPLFGDDVTVVDFRDDDEPEPQEELMERRVIGTSIGAEAGPAQAGNRPRATPLVEDTSVVGGLDADGRPVIRPKRADGSVSEDVQPTDPREAPQRP